MSYFSCLKRQIFTFAMSLYGTLPLFGLVLLAALCATDGLETVVRPGSGSAVTVSTDRAQCSVCEVTGANGTETTCHQSLPLTAGQEVKLLFKCADPIEQAFSVSIKHTIECTKTSCTPDSAEVDPSLFKGFKRTLTWDISLPQKTVLTLDFPELGVEETSESETCPDGLRYFISSSRSDGSTKEGSYCRGTALSSLNLPGETKVVLEVPKDGNLDQTLFEVKAAERGSRMISVTTDPNTKITISQDRQGPDCNVCVYKDDKKICTSKQVLRDPRNISVEFTCGTPQDIFTVEIIRDIDCAKTSCSGDILQNEYSMFPDFNRTFIWDLKVDSTQAFQLDFPKPGMRQIPNKQICPDEHTYSVVTYLRTGPATIGTFCKGGTVSSVLVRYKGRMFLQVPGDRKLDPVDFKFSKGPQTDMVAIVIVNLPRGVSDTSFTTPNYPRDFPDNEQMQWDFVVPGMHNYSMSFNDYTLPECLSKDVALEYHKEDLKVTKLSLTDLQPKHQQGKFKMVLKNCETNRTLEGLTLNFKVSVMRSGHPVLCTVDLTQQQRAVSVQIEKVGSDEYCEITVNSKLQTKINVAPGSKASLSFLDCPNEDVRLMATEVIGCQGSSCPETLLSVPKLDSCLPMPLHSVTWQLLVSKDSTVDLASPTGTLQQSLPNQECTQPFLLHVEESADFTVGDFCFNGPIQKVQAHTNISVTATAPDFTKIKGHLLNVSFSPEITDTMIYKVSPDPESPTLLGSPNWPRGMRPSTTVSWMVTLPGQYEALLQFVNLSQPKCAAGHATISVQMVGYEEELMTCEENRAPEDELIVPYSFNLNMYNCIPDEGEFKTVAKIVLQKKSNILAIALGIAGALLLLLLIVLVVVCVVMKKKNQKLSRDIRGGSFFRPSDRTFSRTRSDNGSHVYDTIDSSRVYGHLIPDSSYAESISDQYKGVQVDSYQTFTGPTIGGLPAIKEPVPEPEMELYQGFLEPSSTFIPSRPRTPISRQDSLGFQDRRMMDNELHTFKSTGDINTIRLSGTDLEPQPPIEPDEYL